MEFGLRMRFSGFSKQLQSGRNIIEILSPGPSAVAVIEHVSHAIDDGLSLRIVIGRIAAESALNSVYGFTHIHSIHPGGSYEHI